jgi:hypothetical protein
VSDDLERRRHDAASGMLGGDEDTFRELLQSIVDVARSIFGAEAASIFLLDDEADELVFEAVAGRYSWDIVGSVQKYAFDATGKRFVFEYSYGGTPRIALGTDPRFSRDRAASTGYVPTSIVASAPPRRARSGCCRCSIGRPTGPSASRSSSCCRASPPRLRSPSTCCSARDVRRRLGDDGSASLVARVAGLLDDADDDQAGLQLLEALERLLR